MRDLGQWKPQSGAFLKLSNGDALFIWEGPSHSPCGGNPPFDYTVFFYQSFVSIMIVCDKGEELSWTVDEISTSLHNASLSVDKKNLILKCDHLIAC